MTTIKTIDDALDARANEALARLEQATEAATAASEGLQPVLRFLGALKTLGAATPAPESTEALLLASVIGDDNRTDAIGEALDMLAELATDLGKQTGTDRTEGDAVAKVLRGYLDATLIEGDDVDVVESALSAWTASAPSKSSVGRPRTGESKGSLPFPVTIACQEHGWKATQSTNRNSIKWAAVLHHEKCHGGRFGKGDKLDANMLDALDKVIGGAETAVDVDDSAYKVTKATVYNVA